MKTIKLSAMGTVLLLVAYAVFGFTPLTALGVIVAAAGTGLSLASIYISHKKSRATQGIAGLILAMINILLISLFLLLWIGLGRSLTF